MKSRKIFTYAAFAILIGIFVLIIQFSSINNPVSAIRNSVMVIRVVDGDTIEVTLSDKKQTVRLIGIDSPEVLDERKPVQCFGKEASSKAKEILNGKTINLESDPTQEERDEYGRLLRYVFLQNGINFNKFMIAEGYAYEYTFKGNAYKYQSEFVQAEREARKKNKGLWGSC